MKLKQFLIYNGYAEEQSIVFLPLFYEDGFDSPLDAMEDLKKVLIGYHNLSDSLAACCKNSRKDRNAVFCSICGKHLGDYDDEDVDYAAANILNQMFSMTLSTMTSLWDFLQEHGWSIGLYRSTNMVTIVNVNNWILDGAYMEWSYGKVKGNTLEPSVRTKINK